MATYDLLASHYDAVTGDSMTEAALIHDIIERRHSRASTLLDVACGTGGITARLACTYQVSGLDISEGMLAVARQKLPEASPLYLADMTSFELNVKFDAIVCSYQGVNHLLSLPSWESFFRRVHEHLNDSGVFVFDIITVGALMRMASIPKMVESFAENYLLIRVRSTDGAVFDWQIEVYECQPDGRYRLLTASVAMRSFPLDRIRETLRQWFACVEAIDGNGRPAGKDHEDRIWFACTRPAPHPPRMTSERSLVARPERAEG